MSEVEGDVRAGPGLANEAAPHELLEGVDDLVLGPAAGAPHQAGVERPADHGGGREHLGARFGHRCEALADERADRPPRAVAVDVGAPASGALASGVGAQQRLDQEQGQSLGLREQLVGSSRAEPTGGGRRHEVEDGVPVEAFQAHLFHERKGLDGRRERGAELVEVLGSPGEDQQERATGQAPGEPGEHRPGGVVGPLQVLDRDEPGVRPRDER